MNPSVQHGLHLASNKSTSLNLRHVISFEVAAACSRSVLLQDETWVFVIGELFPDRRACKLEGIGIVRAHEGEPVSNELLSEGILFRCQLGEGCCAVESKSSMKG